MTGHLPVLQAAMSDKKYKAMMRIIDMAIPKLDDDEPLKIQQHTDEAKVSSNKDASTYADLRRASAFQFAQLQELILEEDTDDEGEDEKFEEASDGTPTNAPTFHQKNFELKFTVDRLQGSLFRADPDGIKPDTELVSLVAEHFDFELCIRPYDLSAVVVLKSLNVEDLVDEDPSPGFKRIVTSDGLTKSSENPLFFVKYIQVKHESPEFMSVYEAIDKHIDVQISTIDVVITRKTVLTILDFVITTFTNPDTPAQLPPKGIEVGEGTEVESGPSLPMVQEQKIRVKVDLDSIALILNNDGIRLATLSLDSADLGIFVMGKTLRIGGRLGNFSLIDDINEGANEDSPFRQLVSIQGDELADFRYETFDPEAKGSYPGYNSSIFLRSGSIKVNFVEEPFRKIIDFAVKFGRMQALFNAARQAAMSQANQIQENADKIHFDILVRTPIVVFPKVGSNTSKGDLMTAYLGELYAQNTFAQLDDTEDSVIANKISAGIRKTRLTSEFHYEGGQREELELLDQLDLSFAVTYLEHVENATRPDIEVEGSMSDLNLKLTQNQYKFLLELSRSIPGVFAGESEDERGIVEQLPEQTKEPAKSQLVELEKRVNTDGRDGKVVHLNPELGTGPDTWTKLDLVFKVGSIGMELFSSEPDKAITDLEGASLSRASLNSTNIKLRMISDGSLESELLIESFNIKDSRKQETNKFRKIMSSTHKEGSQFMASVTLSGGAERNLVALLTIDSPRIIFALDYIFALRNFVMSGLVAEEDVQSELEEDSESDALDTPMSTKPASLATSKRSQSTAHSTSAKPKDSRAAGIMVSFRANVVDSQVILIANPSISNSEAIVLSTKQVLLSQQHALTLTVEKVGMFLCRMDRPDTSRLRILDDFTLKVAMDSRAIGRNSSLQSIHVGVEPLVLRVSLRDILLAVQIFNKASEMSGRTQKPGSDEELQKTKSVKGSSSLKRRTASGRGASTKAGKPKTLVTTRSISAPPQKSTPGTSSIAVRREELKAEIEGMRVILIGDQHELPLLDLSVKKFTARVSDWSGEVSDVA